MAQLGDGVGMRDAHLKQCSEYAQYMQAIGWKVERSGGVFAYIKKVPGLPVSLMKVQRLRVQQLQLDWFQDLCLKYRVIQHYIEFSDEAMAVGQNIAESLYAARYKETVNGMLPSKTRLIGLIPDEEILLAQMHRKTRYNIGLAKRRGLEVTIYTGSECVETPEYLHNLQRLLRVSAKRGGFWGIQERWLKAQLEAFGKNAYVVVITQRGVWLAAATHLCAGEAAYYEHNGATDAGRRVAAPTLAVWEGMMEAKRRGQIRYDFDGVWDERAPKVTTRFVGFSKFKASFGGVPYYYPMAYVKWGWWR